MPDIVTPPDALMQLSNALSDFSDKLDKYIKAADDPFTSEMTHLQTFEMQIAMDAKVIAGMAADLAAPGVLQAIGDLKVQVASAQQTLQTISNVKLALSLVGSVLSAAAAISSGNPLGAATAVLGLVDGIKGAIGAANS